jgi:hypothetical protein
VETNVNEIETCIEIGSCHLYILHQPGQEENDERCGGQAVMHCRILAMCPLQERIIEFPTFEKNVTEVV